MLNFSWNPYRLARWFCAVLAVAFSLSWTAPLAANPKKDEQLSATLKDVHNRGAELYNQQDYLGCLRIFEAALTVTRAALDHHPDLQKWLDGKTTQAAAMDNTGDRAFFLHEVIEDLRKQLKEQKPETLTFPKEEKAKEEKRKEEQKKEAKAPEGKSPPPERLTIPEWKAETKPADSPKGAGNNPLLKTEVIPYKPLEKTESKAEAQPAAKVDPKQGLTGTLYWEGEELGNVGIVFIRKDGATPKVYEATTDAKGRYFIPGIEKGRYITLLIPPGDAAKHPLPARYRTADTSPLIYEVAGPGDKIDFLLK